MPVYDYMCGGCGPFTQSHPMSACADPQDCPRCGASAPRAILSAPHFSSLDAGRRTAHAVNERSAHAPSSSSKGGGHGAGCGCCGPGLRRTKSAPEAAKGFPAARPWMISH